MSDELLAREARAYAAFEEVVAGVPLERWGEQVLTDDWSVKDVLWHVAFWWHDGVQSFGEMRAGTYTDEEWTAEQTDATNARVLAESRSMTATDVEAGLGAARAALLEAFAPLAGDPVADELFVSETIEHYEEHLPALRGLAAP